MAIASGFELELGRAPKKVWNAYERTIKPLLQKQPDQPDGERLKRLRGYKGLWRARLGGDYRLVYRVVSDEQLVILLMLGHRGTVYDRLGLAADGTPGPRIVANASELLEEEPSETAVGQARVDQAQASSPPTHSPDAPLPVELDAQQLIEWGVGTEYHKSLCGIQTEGELLSLEGTVPSRVIERVLNGLWPPSIEQVVERPVRMLEPAVTVDAVAQEERSLDSFLLKLDDEQKSFVARFGQRQPKGPWLLKGGPGSGKSTVALYCIRELVRQEDALLEGHSRRLNILFTTFTHSLVNASGHLLRSLGVDHSKHRVTIQNIDKIATRYLASEWTAMSPATPREQHALLADALRECQATDSQFAFTPEDAQFLGEEIDWVIIGQGVATVDEYLTIERTGRGGRWGPNQRRHAWRVYEAFIRRLRARNQFLFGERLIQALKNAKRSYDYVFIDEAQDLSPVGIRLCLALCKDPTNTFLTADTNQSIYGNAWSWPKISSELRFSGRARLLRRNYRTTHELWEAIGQLCPASASSDRETLESEPTFHGPAPVFARCSRRSAQRERLNSFIHESAHEERVGPSSVAVLCPSHKEMDGACQMIHSRYNPKIMHSRDADLAHPGVKVLTMHAAKGLQFPVVIVFGVSAKGLPRQPEPGSDLQEHEERERRLLFVACSRAMRRLMVMGSAVDPSPFVSAVSDECWQIEDL